MITALLICLFLLTLSFTGCIEKDKTEESTVPINYQVEINKTSVLPDWNDGEYHDYIDNLRQWKTPDIQPLLPEGVPPEPLK